MAVLMYHVTKQVHLDSIMKEGLIPGGKEVKFDWAAADLLKTHRTKGVFLSDTLEVADKWMSRRERYSPVMLTCLVDPSTLVKDYAAYDKGCWFYPGTIDPMLIEISHVRQV